MFLSLAMTLILSALREAFKNPVKKAQLKDVMLKLWRSIRLTYADDPDFEC